MTGGGEITKFEETHSIHAAAACRALFQPAALVRRPAALLFQFAAPLFQPAAEF
jgi:hypothetical protein